MRCEGGGGGGEREGGLGELGGAATGVGTGTGKWQNRLAYNSLEAEKNVFKCIFLLRRGIIASQHCQLEIGDWLF